jgi:hypothetical protein
MFGRPISSALISVVLGFTLAGAIAFGQGTDPDAPAIIPVAVPSEPLAKAAFDVLQARCSRCHQEGQLTKLKKPAKNFGFILELDKLAADPHYVTPGNPDDSKIVKMILNQEMPYDVWADGNLDEPEVSPEELTALRDWISSLGGQQADACATRQFITPEAMTAAMLADLGQAQQSEVDDTRYLTLTHLYNACASDEAMEVYRQGAVKLLNSLSYNSDVVRLETIDPEKTIVGFRLSELRWTPSQWDAVLSVYPYAAVPDTVEFKALAEATDTPLPYVEADWFAFVAARPPLYHRLLDLPEDFAALEKELGIDVAANIENYMAERAGFQRSGVSASNRLIERHSISTGYFWTSYDFGGNRNRQSLFDFPLGPEEGEFSFHHDGGETIFSLPNGFQGYYLNSAAGLRLDKGPTDIVRDTSKRDLAVTNGISCIGCHDTGTRKAKDEIRDRVLADRGFPKVVRDTVEELYPPTDVMDRRLEGDGKSFQDALMKAGLTPALKLNGVEMINALSDRYEQDVEIAVAAAQYGHTPDSYKSAVTGAANADALRMGRRLQQGLVPRDTFEAQFLDTVSSLSDLVPVDLGRIHASIDAPVVVAPVARPIEDSHSFDLSITSNQLSYHVDDLATFTVTTDHDCYVTLIDVDNTGEATVLYPNRFEQNNLLSAGNPLQFPGKDAAFQFRLGDAGKETVIAICSLADKPVDNISYDFASNDLVPLGNYAEHLARKITVEANAGGKPSSNIIVRTAVQVEVR